MDQQPNTCIATDGASQVGAFDVGLTRPAQAQKQQDVSLEMMTSMFLPPSHPGLVSPADFDCAV